MYLHGIEEHGRLRRQVDVVVQGGLEVVYVSDLRRSFCSLVVVIPHVVLCAAAKSKPVCVRRKAKKKGKKVL